jgi:predicted RNA-binding protein with TRAM domain
MASLSTTVTNAGTSSVTLSGSPAVTGLGVTVVGGTCASGAVIAPAGTCTIVLGWTPQATGALADATVSFTHPDGPAASDVIALTGTASAAVRSIDSGAERTVRLTDPAPATTSSATAASCPATPALSALSGGRTIPLAGGKVVVRLAGFGATGKALSLRGSALILQAGGKLAVRVTGAKACSDVNVRVAATKGARAATQITSTLRVASSGAGGATVVLPGGLAAGGYTVVVTGAPATGAPWTAQAAAVVTGSKTGRSARH